MEITLENLKITIDFDDDADHLTTIFQRNGKPMKLSSEELGEIQSIIELLVATIPIEE